MRLTLADAGASAAAWCTTASYFAAFLAISSPSLSGLQLISWAAMGWGQQQSSPKRLHPALAMLHSQPAALQAQAARASFCLAGAAALFLCLAGSIHKLYFTMYCHLVPAHQQALPKASAGTAPVIATAACQCSVGRAPSGCTVKPAACLPGTRYSADLSGAAANSASAPCQASTSTGAAAAHQHCMGRGLWSAPGPEEAAYAHAAAAAACVAAKLLAPTLLCLLGVRYGAALALGLLQLATLQRLLSATACQVCDGELLGLQALKVLQKGFSAVHSVHSWAAERQQGADDILV